MQVAVGVPALSAAAYGATTLLEIETAREMSKTGDDPMPTII